MESRAPRVSAIVPVFNGESTIAAAIASVLAQHYDGEIEIVVVDDGSTDRTASVLERYAGRIRVVTQNNRGPAAARNAGVRASHGEYVAFLDADDAWMPGKVAKAVSALETDGGTAMVYTNARIVNEGGEQLSRNYTPEAQRCAPTMKEMLSGLWNILPSTAVMRRATFDKIGGFREEFATGYPQWEDSYFMLVAREQGRFLYLDEPTVLYRVTGSVAEKLERRRVWKAGAVTSEMLGADRYVRNSELMQRLVRERFGDRAVRLIGEIRHATARLLVSVGLTAMLDGDRLFARHCYWFALRYESLNAKTYVRIAWTLLPESLARLLTVAMPESVARRLRGPAYGG